MLSLVMGPSDRALVARVVVDDDRHAFATLVRNNQSAVRSFAMRLCAGDAARAEDTAQDAFLLAYKHLASWRGEGELVSWLLKLTYRAFLTDARRAHRRREHQSDDGSVPERDGGDAPHEPSSKRDVTRALATLKDEERAAIALCFQQGLTHEEAARVLEMPLGTLKSHVARGKDKLKTLLAGYAPEAA